VPELTRTLNQISIWGLPLTFILAGALFGYMIERVFLHRLRELSKASRTRWDDIIVDALRHAPMLWFGALGAYAALQMLPLSPQASRLIRQLLVVLVLLSITVVAARIVGEVVSQYAQRTRSPLPASSLVTNISKLVIMIAGVLLILQNLGVSITPLVTGLGIGGLAVALAIQPTLANLFAGFQVIASGQVRRGDYIRLDSGEEGHVVDVHWRNTTIRGTQVNVGVHYDSDLQHVERVAMDVAREVASQVPGARADQEPLIRFRGFGDSSVDFTMFILTDEFAERLPVQHEFIKRLHARFAEEGIVIPFPIRTLHLPEPLRIADRGAKEGQA
jgi:small-conductance mechanosensitive channel